jgi:hypothetical protein
MHKVNASKATIAFAGLDLFHIHGNAIIYIYASRKEGATPTVAGSAGESC